MSTALIAGCSPPPPQPTTLEGPPKSVILLVVDTLPSQTLGCYGNTRDTSPVIDALASRGALFERVYAPSNWTVPATASLLTSLYPSEHGAGFTGEMRHLSGKNPPNRLGKSAQTIAELTAEHGLRTALFSANPYLTAGMEQGYEVSEVERLPANELSDLAIDWIRSLETNSFFLHLQYMDLHIPVEPPAEFGSLYAPDGADMADPALKNWRFGRGKDATGPVFEDYRRRRIALHDGAMRYIDTEIGRLLEVLDERGWLADTVVAITSDHGEEFWQHVREGYALGGDPRDMYGIGHGHAMFDETVRVPLVLSGPGIPPGLRSGALVSLVDVAPTLLDILGFEIPQQMKGHSLRPLLGSNGRPVWETRALLVESPSYGPDSIAIVRDHHKLIVRSDGHELFFDLVADPLERNNLVTDDPRSADALRQLMTKMVSEMVAKTDGEHFVMDEDTEDQLRALGYVE